MCILDVSQSYLLDSMLLIIHITFSYVRVKLMLDGKGRRDSVMYLLVHYYFEFVLFGTLYFLDILSGRSSCVKL